jgi:hypothetical protein
MATTTVDTTLIGRALAYVIELYRDLTDENGARTLGTQNQIVDFILDDPELREAVAQWGEAVETNEARTRAPKRLPDNAAYRRIRDFAESLYRPAGVYAAESGAPRSALIWAAPISASLLWRMTLSVAGTTSPACRSLDRRRSCTLQICLPL